MSLSLKIGNSAYVVDNKRFLREVIVMNTTGDFCVIKYIDTGSLIRVRNSRLFLSKKEAELTMPPSARTGKNHWDYELLNI